MVRQGVSRDALSALDRLFPERCPELADSVDEIRFKAGQRSVVRMILSLHNER